MAKTEAVALTAAGIVALLSSKHSKDLFVPECKTGPTWGGSPIRLDAWVMNRSWSKMTFTGYEVKVSKADFRNDDKWPQYLPYVHRFFFVCPYGMIEKAECPEGVGLMWVSKMGRQITTKVHAPRRDMELVDALPLLLYILMCRADIGPNRWRGDSDDNLLYWQTWMNKKAESRELGHKVASAIAAMVNKAKNDAAFVKTRTKDIEKVEALLQEVLGVGLSTLSSWRGKQQLEGIATLVPQNLVRQLEMAQGGLGTAIDALTEFKEGKLSK